MIYLQVSASRSDILEAEEGAAPDQGAEQRLEEGLFDMVGVVQLYSPTGT